MPIDMPAGDPDFFAYETAPLTNRPPLMGEASKLADLLPKDRLRFIFDKLFGAHFGGLVRLQFMSSGGEYDKG